MQAAIKYLFAAVIISILGVSTVLAAPVNDSGAKVAWGYKGSKGPTHWGQLSPAFTTCTLGKFQSPVNIEMDTLEAPTALKFSYQSAPMIIVDDGDTELTIGNSQMLVNTGHGVQLNFYGDRVKESIRYLGERYELEQFHFHTPSETEIDGEGYPMEIHFVHQGSEGRVVVVAVLVEGGDSNPELQKIIDHLPPHNGKEREIKDKRVNPNDLLPLMKNYYSFMGSLTTPPCTEGVQWIVLEDSITASPAQIVALRKAMEGPNARSVQALNERVISYSIGKKS